jgi:hypothetical protein
VEAGERAAQVVAVLRDERAALPVVLLDRALAPEGVESDGRGAAQRIGRSLLPRAVDRRACSPSGSSTRVTRSSASWS